jgi:hypothetical protein
MHPTISYQLAQTRMAELRDQALRDARAVGSGRPGRRRQAGAHPWAMHPATPVPGAGHAAHPAVAADAPTR